MAVVGCDGDQHEKRTQQQTKRQACRIHRGKHAPERLDTTLSIRRAGGGGGAGQT